MNTSAFRAPPLCSYGTDPVSVLDEFHTVKSKPDQIFSLVMASKTRATKQSANADPHVVNASISLPYGLGAAGIPLPRWKRGIDLAACILALPFLGLCALVMTLLTRCVSPGPVFFRQERIGYMGRRFKIYKFRTMKVRADCSVHRDHTANLIRTNAPMVKLDSRGDARLIPLGWLMRASGLDELPQLLNVLRGEMSLVGPRPCIPTEFEHYTRSQRQRCDALPGLTGLWQISGKNRTTFEQMIRFDLQYAREFSFWLDLKIIFLTPPCLLVQLRDTRRARKSQPESGHARSSETSGAVASQPHLLHQSAVLQEDGAPSSLKNGVAESESLRDPSESLHDWLHNLRRRSARTQSAEEIEE
jgi:lipopolysaccharide/colanic/teichoic acid biosynthesis glycosyltransferase